jgi:thymidylate synthase ThyX
VNEPEEMMAQVMDVRKGVEIVANDASRGLVPGWGGRISASLIYDGTDEVRIPPSMGKPRLDQMQGTARERLAELCGRVCYDSLGKGRDSKGYHEHIQQVRHFSTIESTAFTVEFSVGDVAEAAVALLNRPGIWVEWRGSGAHVTCRVTANLLAALEWRTNGPITEMSCAIGEILKHAAHELAPRIVAKGYDRASRIVEPETDDEKWITLYLTGSRGWSHELVRHGDFTAISQRSTRYVDESESEWVMHPLIAKFLEEHPGGVLGGELKSDIKSDAHGSKLMYLSIVGLLQPWLEARGVNKVSARKQARGAARGVLGNALETEVIFSGSVRAFRRHILPMRAADAADAEIRLGFAEAALPCLKASRYGDRFADLTLVAASDGIGRSLAGGGAK